MTNSGDGTVSVFTTTANPVTKTIPVDTSPWGLALVPDGTQGVRHQQRHHHRHVITTATDTVQYRHRRKQPGRPCGHVPDGAKVLVANNGARHRQRHRDEQQHGRGTVNVASGPRVVTISPDGVTAYVTSTGVNMITPITVATNTAGTGIASAGGPESAVLLARPGARSRAGLYQYGEAQTSIRFDATASSDRLRNDRHLPLDFGDGSHPLLTQAGPTTTHTMPMTARSRRASQ